MLHSLKEGLTRMGETQMSYDERSTGGTAFMMFVLGAASGAAVALLCAPQSGRDSRDYLKRRAREAREQATAAASKARDAVAQGAESVATSIDDWRSTVNSAMEDGRDVVQQGRDTVAYAIEQGREAYQQVKAGPA